MIAGRPTDVALPDAVRTLIASRSYKVVWRNDVGGLTFCVHNGDGSREFVKWTPAGGGIDLMREITRLSWAAAWIRVPRVIAHGADADGQWMITAALAGESAVSPRWVQHPSVAVTAIGRGLRALHDTLPVATCPFSWSIADRLADIQRRASRGDINEARWNAEHPGQGLDAALRAAADPPTIDRLVVCHGDACAPNTLIDDDGRWSGHVDLGDLGIADRWADLVIASWSTTFNYGPGWEDALLAAYGVEPDPRRMQYYQLLWDLGP